MGNLAKDIILFKKKDTQFDEYIASWWWVKCLGVSLDLRSLGSLSTVHCDLYAKLLGFMEIIGMSQAFQIGMHT